MEQQSAVRELKDLRTMWRDGIKSGRIHVNRAVLSPEAQKKIEAVAANQPDWPMEKAKQQDRENAVQVRSMRNVDLRGHKR